MGNRPAYPLNDHTPRLKMDRVVICEIANAAPRKSTMKILL